MSQIESTRRLLRNTQAEFERAIFSGKNESGVRPIGTSVLVLMDQVAKKSSGGIVLPQEFAGKMDMASESGVIVAVGDAAFSYYDDGSKWLDYKPKPGDRVFTERYAGRELLGQDGNTYRMMTYTCIAGIEDAYWTPGEIDNSDGLGVPVDYSKRKKPAKSATKKKG